MNDYEIYSEGTIVTLELHKTKAKDFEIVAHHMIQAADNIGLLVNRLDLLVPPSDEPVIIELDKAFAKILGRPWWIGKVEATDSVKVPTFRDSFGNHVLKFTGAYTA